jgi:hypothetical protein
MIQLISTLLCNSADGVEVFRNDFILELDVGLLISHLPVVQQVSQVSLLDEPLEELAEGSLEGDLGFAIGYEQHGQVPWTSNVLDLRKVVVVQLIVGAVVLEAEGAHSLLVGFAQAFADRAFGDVAADVLLVVGFLVGFADLTGQVEDLDLPLFLLWQIQNELLLGFSLFREQEILLTRPITVDGRVEELIHRVHGIGGAQAGLGHRASYQERRTTHIDKRLHLQTR